jgi:hypothetical protein
VAFGGIERRLAKLGPAKKGRCGPLNVETVPRSASVPSAFGSRSILPYCRFRRKEASSTVELLSPCMLHAATHARMSKSSSQTVQSDSWTSRSLYGSGLPFTQNGGGFTAA